jgi:hypothetical protein
VARVNALTDTVRGNELSHASVGVAGLNDTD